MNIKKYICLCLTLILVVISCVGVFADSFSVKSKKSSGYVNVTTGNYTLVYFKSKPPKKLIESISGGTHSRQLAVEYASYVINYKSLKKVDKLKFKIKPYSKKFVVSFKDANKGYCIKYSTNKNLKNSKTLFTNKKRITFKNLKKKTKYYFKIQVAKKFYFAKTSISKDRKYMYCADYNSIQKGYIYGKSIIKSVKTK